MEFTELKNCEKSRTYIFPTGVLKVESVTSICIRPSGTHRLQTKDGQKWIIPSGWIGIKIEADEWSL